MDVLPSIDLRGGRVVRLAQGDYRRETTYSSVPSEVAAAFAEAGAKWIHVVDLDGARTGRPTNHREILTIRRVADEHGIKIELGGGARDNDTIGYMLKELADRVVVGSAALKNWAWFEGLLRDRELAGRLALGLDARGGYLAAEGWTEQLTETAGELAGRVAGSGLGAIVYTDIARDGMLCGVNVEATKELVSATDVPIIASGGIQSIEDILLSREFGCSGVIVGRAYYEGKIDIARAIAEAG